MAYLQRLLIFFVGGLFLASGLVGTVVASGASTNIQDDSVRALRIYELQLGSPLSGSAEFVTIYNPSNDVFDATEIDLQYRSSSGDGWSSKVSSEQIEGHDTQIQARGFYTYASDQFIAEHPNTLYHARLTAGLADSGGHIRIAIKNSDVSASDLETIDLIGWGTAMYAYGNPALSPSRGKSLQRLFDQSGFIVDTQNNMTDFWVSDDPLIRSTFPIGQPQDLQTDEEAPHNDPNDQNDTDMNTDTADEHPEANNDTLDEEAIEQEHLSDSEQVQTEPACSKAIVISEILPNPQGPRSEFPRAENAFIELHNTSNKAVSLYGCGLHERTTPESVYWFTEGYTMPPHSYVALFQLETGIDLPVSPSGTVFLVSNTNVEVHSVTYPPSTPEAASWSWFGDGIWKTTYATTPSATNEKLDLKPCPEGQERNPDTNRCRSFEIKTQNILQSCGPGRERNPETNRCKKIVDPLRQLKPCGPGQERNPETNRCRKIATATSQLKPCGPGQERNPETNRCRAIQPARRALKPCGPGQERNPETNRCRKIATATSQLKPCGPGQERNPETNRCRKIVQDAKSVMGVQDIYVEQASDMIDWAMTAGVFGLASAYGLWEWRSDIKKVRNRLFFRKKA